jgi:RNA polymerase sigma-70 factor (ECF subfamily)
MADGSDPWTVWLKQHGAALVLLARQWVASQADAEDVVQDAFVRCWKARERIQDPLAYLYASVRHCALDWLRARGRQERRETAAARSEFEPLLAAPAEAEERRMAIERALRDLPESQAEVVVMKIWGGLTMAQIAAALETSTNTVSSRYRYAIAKLRQQLVEEPIG